MGMLEFLTGMVGGFLASAVVVLPAFMVGYNMNGCGSLAARGRAMYAARYGL